MLAPSKATPMGWVPTAKVPSVAPLLARSLVTLLLPSFATQMLAPSKATNPGHAPTAKVPSVEPSEARSLLTLLLAASVTQMLAPSKATPKGKNPTAKVPSVVPSEARSLLTVLFESFTTQMLPPSKATPVGSVPTGKLAVWLALYQCRMATWSGFLGDLTTPDKGAPGCATSATSFWPCRRGRCRTVTSPHRTIAKTPSLTRFNFPSIAELCFFTLQPPNLSVGCLYRNMGTDGRRPTVLTILILGGPSFRGFCERVGIPTDEVNRTNHFRGPSFPPHHVTSNLVPAILISDDDRCRDEMLQSKSPRSKSFVSRILVSKLFESRILRAISC